MLERMREQGLYADIRTLVERPTLYALAEAIAPGGRPDSGNKVAVPPNRIPTGCMAITPDMLPLVKLESEHIARIAGQVPGGSTNIQDIYPLAPLQEGILYHDQLHQQGDPYLLSPLFSFDSQQRLDGFIQALQAVVDRHDVLRTAVLWEGLFELVLVVWRSARFEVEMPSWDGGDTAEQLQACAYPARYRLDLRRAPLMRALAAFDVQRQRWLLLLIQHHLIVDHVTSDLLMQEVARIQAGRGHELPEPVPFRNQVAHTRSGVTAQEHEAYFRDMLGDVQEQTAPFGVWDVRGDGRAVREAQLMSERTLSRRLRRQAKAQGVSTASLFHWAWGQVLAKTTGLEDVVFGTVLLGRSQGGEQSDRGMGLFINTLPVRIALGETSVREGVQQMHRLLASLMWHEHAPLALAQRCSALPSATPLFSALLNYHYSAAALGIDQELGWGEGVEVLSFQERSNYLTCVSVEDSGRDDFRLIAQVAQPFDPQRVCGYMQRALLQLTRALEQAPQTPAWRIGVMDEAEQRLVLHTWNGASRNFSQCRCVHVLFEKQAQRTPGEIAVEQGGRHVSYRDLDEGANSVAHRLRALGVGPDERVAIYLRRGVGLVSAMLATLKSGGSYVPLDVELPRPRLAHMLRDSACRLVLTDRELRAQLSDWVDVPIVEVDAERRSHEESRPVQVDRNPANLAYVIYTSGSTGNPKGVMVSHANLINLVCWHGERFGLKPGRRTSSTAGVGFDACTWEVWPALCTGATLVLPPAEKAGDPLQLLDWWAAQELVSNFQVTTLAEAALARPLPGKRLKSLLTGGDRLGRLPEKALPFELINNYGPTESTVVATSGRIHSQDEEVHIGRPIANARVYLLDAHRQPVPVGVAGEIYVGGAGVARGYLNQPQLTRERFLVDPFSGEPGARMYKTGDLGRWLPNGTIEFLGRNDHQVKIRGFRIELGEIETQLKQLAGVREAVVLLREDLPGSGRLVAYLVAAGPVDTAELRQALAAKLPEYMVPTAYVALDRMPLTPNGKLDRKALPAPQESAYLQRLYEAPQGEVELALAQIWSQLLQVERVGRQDHFFHLGGHTKTTKQLISRVSQFYGVTVTLPDLFASPLLSEFAKQVGEAARDELPALRAGERPDALPVSFAQQRLWFISQKSARASAALHLHTGLRLVGALDARALRAALARIVQRHESLRTCFEVVDGQPVQRIAQVGEGAALELRGYDLSAELDRSAALQQHRHLEATEGFDLSRSPLIRGRLLRLGAQEHVLLLTMHHIVSDGWSLSVLVKELEALYRAYALEGVSAQTDPLPPLRVQYADYALWQRQGFGGAVQQEQLAYWRTHLAGAAELVSLPTDRPRPAVQDYAGASIEVQLDERLSAALKELSRKHGTTLYMTLLAAWSALVGCLVGQAVVVIGSPVANRTRVEIEPLIGFFVNTLALRIDLSGQPTVGELLDRVRRSVLQGQAHQDVPFEQVVEALNPVRTLAHSPLFQLMFTWQNTSGQALTSVPLQLEELPEGERHSAKFDLSLGLQEAGSRIVGTLGFATSLYERATMMRHVEYLKALLRGMARDDSQVVDGIEILDESERRQVLQVWNDSQRDYPLESSVVQL